MTEPQSISMDKETARMIEEIQDVFSNDSFSPVVKRIIREYYNDQNSFQVMRKD